MASVALFATVMAAVMSKKVEYLYELNYGCQTVKNPIEKSYSANIVKENESPVLVPEIYLSDIHKSDHNL